MQLIFMKKLPVGSQGRGRTFSPTSATPRDYPKTVSDIAKISKGKQNSRRDEQFGDMPLPNKRGASLDKLKLSRRVN